MTNYEKIKAIIESGHIAQVDLDNWEYTLFSTLRWDGSIYRSDIDKTLEGLWDRLCKIYHYKTDINESNMKSITVYNKPLWYPRPWDLVEILPTVKDCPWRSDGEYRYSYMIGWPFEVKGNRNIQYVSNCEVWNKDKSDRDCFDYRCLVPRIEDELSDDEANEMIKKLRKAGKIKKWDILFNK